MGEEEDTNMVMVEEDLPMEDKHGIPPEGCAPCVVCDMEEE
jgi:hypothetical protein